MIRRGWLAALAVVLATSPCPAQFGGMGGGPGMGGMGGMGGGMGRARAQAHPVESWSVRFETFDGQSVTGKLQIASVSVACSLGLYEIRPEKIKAIELKPASEPPMFVNLGAQREGSVVTNSGESITGKVSIPEWKVETELGTLTPDAQHLKAVTFVDRLDGPKPAAEPVKAAAPASAKPAEPEKQP